MKPNKKANKLEISNLRAALGEREILQGVSLRVYPGQVAVVMGPNGGGKSTLASVLLGSPTYEVQKGSVINVDGIDVTALEPNERAKAGLFLAFQSPIAIPGVSVSNLLRSAYQQIHPGGEDDTKLSQNPAFNRKWKGDITIGDFAKCVKEAAKDLQIPEHLLSRGIHDGFSGGERKKIEMLQALVLKPRYAVFDEIDTGLDVDALRFVAQGISTLVKQGTGVIVITHYQRILSHLNPDIVYILSGGKVVQSGDKTLVSEIEINGYGKWEIGE